MTPEMNRERAINLLNEFGLPLDEERIIMIGDFLVIWIGWELRHVQQPATEPDAFYKQYSEQDVPHGAMPPCRHFFRNSMSSEPGDYVCKLCGAIGVEISPDQQRALAIREPATEPLILANLTKHEFERLSHGRIPYSGAAGDPHYDKDPRPWGKHAPYIATYLEELISAVKAMKWTHFSVKHEHGQWLALRDVPQGQCRGFVSGADGKCKWCHHEESDHRFWLAARQVPVGPAKEEKNA